MDFLHPLRIEWWNKGNKRLYEPLPICTRPKHEKTKNETLFFSLPTLYIIAADLIYYPLLHNLFNRLIESIEKYLDLWWLLCELAWLSVYMCEWWATGRVQLETWSCRPVELARCAHCMVYFYPIRLPAITLDRTQSQNEYLWFFCVFAQVSSIRILRMNWWINSRGKKIICSFY